LSTQLKIPEQVSREGTSYIAYLDILLVSVMYLDSVSIFQLPGTADRPGYFVGFVGNLGD
jgi:hypothetical protein